MTHLRVTTHRRAPVLLDARGRRHTLLDLAGTIVLLERQWARAAADPTTPVGMRGALERALASRYVGLHVLEQAERGARHGA